MGSGAVDDYCSYAKAVEHLGDRWSLLIVTDLILSGPQGFSALADRLPGRVSRSVLADKLRKLQDLGLVSRTGQRGSGGGYQLTAVGQGLAPTILSLRTWAATWLPDDPALAERDPDVVLAWLKPRIDVARLPRRRVVVEIKMRHEHEHRGWLVLERGLPPVGCLQDPMLDETRYVYVEAAVTVLLALARGGYGWADALADGSIAAFGDPDLTRQLPDWFGSAGVREDSPRLRRPAS